MSARTARHSRIVIFTWRRADLELPDDAEDRCVIGLVDVVPTQFVGCHYSPARGIWFDDADQPMETAPTWWTYLPFLPDHEE